MSPAGSTSTSGAADPNAAREDALAALEKRTFDLLVIGGGVTGCGIARDAALRGMSVALVEKDDFGAGTSSRSSKLIHGGLRYLEHAQFKLVFEGTNERALLLKRAPHLVSPLPFLVPAYKEVGHGLFKLDVGLWIYDALSKFSSPKLHKTYRGRRILEMEPGLRTERLKGGIVYYDCLTDDARITLENALAARDEGGEAVLVNHVRATRLLHHGQSGRIVGAEVTAQEPGQSAARPIRVRARVTVNATGPWTDEIRALAGEKAILKPTKGVHVVVDARRLPLKHALVMLARQDHRVMFAIPWGPRSVIGTTDTFYDGDLDHVFADAADVAYLLETANYYFPGAELTPQDVLATWAGLRPLLAPGSDIDASDVSREHHVIERQGFITIAGGKLTTYRRMAAEVVDRVGQQLGRVPPVPTANRSLPGAVGVDGEEDLVKLAESLAAAGPLDAAATDNLVHTYGIRANTVARRAAADPTAAAPIDPELAYVMAQVDEAVEVELARSLDDVLARRIPLLLRGRDQGLAAAPAVAERMARALDWSEARAREEVDRYRALVDESRRFRTA